MNNNEINTGNLKMTEKENARPWSRAAEKAELLALKTQVEDLILKLSGTEADYKYASEYAISLEENIHELQIENARLRDIINKDGEQWEKTGLNTEVLLTAYDWTIGTDGKVLGLVAGDMGYEAAFEATGIDLSGDHLKFWQEAVEALRIVEAFKSKIDQQETEIVSLKQMLEKTRKAYDFDLSVSNSRLKLLQDIRHENEQLKAANTGIGEQYSKDRAIISHLENEHNKLAKDYNDLREIYDRTVLENSEKTEKDKKTIANLEDSLKTLAKECYTVKKVRYWDEECAAELNKRLEEQENISANLHKALFDREQKYTDAIKECFSKREICLYPSLENLIDTFNANLDFYDEHIELLEEKNKKTEQEKDYVIEEITEMLVGFGVDREIVNGYNIRYRVGALNRAIMQMRSENSRHRNVVSWDELSRMTINEIMAKVSKNGN